MYTHAEKMGGAKSREVRVFISSTFRDMQEERNELAKRVFPQLRKMCSERGLGFTDVDLRWGVTDEEAAEGKVLPICLAEIGRCRPFFIGLLGERYGWVPKRIPDELIESQPWLSEHQDKSVTELEIIHGVLRNPGMGNRALFYFRDPTYVNTIPPEKRADFAESEPARRAKLTALKDRIRQSGLALHDGYLNPQALGEIVLRDLTVAINQMYPPGPPLDPSEREAADHEAFARSRTGVYIGRPEYFERLDEHVEGDGPPLVVVGEPGSGKSALLANWALRYQESHPNLPIITHFIGASADSADWIAMLLRIQEGLGMPFDADHEDSVDSVEQRSNSVTGLMRTVAGRGRNILFMDEGWLPVRTRADFANSLHMAATRGRIILILDALDQLEDRDEAHELPWLPREIPPNIRIVLSTTPGRPLDTLKRRGWPCLAVEPLDDSERKNLIRNYLAQYTKALNHSQTDLIASADQTSSPLYLRSLLEELRLFGEHQGLNQRIEHYLAAQRVSDLYEGIFARYEEDYERERPGLVRDAMTLVWAARRGLTEAELLQILGDHDAPLPQACWSPFHLAAKHAFVSRSGLIGFSHEQVREAVRARYLPSKEDQDNAHLLLADYFSTLGNDPRAIDELPWLLRETKNWQRLYGKLSDLHFFLVAWITDESEVKSHWAQIEEHTDLSMVDAYRSVIDSPSEHMEILTPSHVSRLLGEGGFLIAFPSQNEGTSIVSHVASLLYGARHLREALSLTEFLSDHYRSAGDVLCLQGLLRFQGSIHFRLYNLDDAMALYREAEQICRELGNEEDLQACLLDQASILRAQGAAKAALLLYKRIEWINRELGNKDGLQRSLFEQANILRERGKLGKAMALYREQERLCRETGNQDYLAQSLGNQAIVLATQGDLDGAEKLHKEEERIFREQGNEDGLALSLGNQGNDLWARGDQEGAEAMYKEQERLSRKLGNRFGLALSLGGQGDILQARGNFAGAMAMYKEAEPLFRELGYQEGLQAMLNNQAVILRKQGDQSVATESYKSLEAVCRQLGKQKGQQAALYDQAHCYFDTGDLESALDRFKEQERVACELGNTEGVAASLGHQAEVLKAQGELNNALELLKRAEGIWREHTNWNGLSVCLAQQAQAIYELDDLDQAMDLHEEAERICRELGDKETLPAWLGQRAETFQAQGDMDSAMELYEEQARLCREFDNKEGLRNSLVCQIGILQERDELEGALDLFGELEQLIRELGDKEALSTVVRGQALILMIRGDLKGAMRLLKSDERNCREQGHMEGLLSSLELQSVILSERGDWKGAMKANRTQEEICRELGDEEGLESALSCQAENLKEQGDLESALERYEELERSCRSNDNVDGLQSCLFNKALLVNEHGDSEGAETLLLEQARICREADHKDGLQMSLRLQALIFRDRGELEKAEALYKEQARICREAGNKEALQTSLRFRANILADREQFEEALALNRESEQICREIGNTEELVYSLINQASLVEVQTGVSPESLLLVKEAYGLANEHGLTNFVRDVRAQLKSVPELPQSRIVLTEDAIIKRSATGQVIGRQDLSDIHGVEVVKSNDTSGLKVAAVIAALSIASKILISSQVFSWIAFGVFGVVALLVLAVSLSEKQLLIVTDHGIVRYDVDQGDIEIAKAFVSSVAVMLTREGHRHGDDQADQTVG